MDIAEFQEKLEEICTLGEANDKQVTAQQVRDCFEGLELEQAQLLKILQYLKLKGISIEGARESSQKPEETQSAEERKVPLTPEEEGYFREYMEEISTSSDHGLYSHYLPLAARMAVEMNCEEIFIADLIQEANVSLLMALGEESEEEKTENWILGRIRAGIRGAIEEQTQRKFEDDYLVAKVQNLEAAVKELTEDDEESKFSIDELAVILDMDVEEIRDVLRLTGDDK